MKNRVLLAAFLDKLSIIFAEVRARMHNWLIRCRGSSLAIGCVMAHSKTRPARGESTKQTQRMEEKSQLLGRFSSVSRLHLVAQDQMKLIRLRCCAQSELSPRARQCSFRRRNFGPNARVRRRIAATTCSRQRARNSRSLNILTERSLRAAGCSY